MAEEIALSGRERTRDLSLSLSLMALAEGEKGKRLARRALARRRGTSEAKDGGEVTPTRRGQAQHQREPTSRSRGEEPAISGPHTNCFYILTLRSVPHAKV